MMKHKKNTLGIFIGIISVFVLLLIGCQNYGSNDYSDIIDSLNGEIIRPSSAHKDFAGAVFETAPEDGTVMSCSFDKKYNTFVFEAKDVSYTGKYEVKDGKLIQNFADEVKRLESVTVDTLLQAKAEEASKKIDRLNERLKGGGLNEKEKEAIQKEVESLTVYKNACASLEKYAEYDRNIEQMKKAEYEQEMNDENTKSDRKKVLKELINTLDNKLALNDEDYKKEVKEGFDSIIETEYKLPAKYLKDVVRSTLLDSNTKFTAKLFIKVNSAKEPVYKNLTFIKK